MKSLKLDGKVYAIEIESNLKQRVEVLKTKGIVPTLATILVGNNPASEMYIKMKVKACERVGILSKRVDMPDTSTTDDVLKVIYELNSDSSVYGILLQHPLPKNIDEVACFNAIDESKDVDGVNVISFGKFAMKQDAFVGCTPLGVVKLLKRYKIPLVGKKVVIVGRSPILGKPLSMLLLNENCTVTICHSKTVNLDRETKRADIVVGASGVKNLIRSVKNGVVLVDCGYNENNIGDIDKECILKSSAYTPIPGGVGPMTIAMLLTQTVKSAERTLK